MTQKSLARRQRDADEAKNKSNQAQLKGHLANNTAWSDLIKTRDSISELLNYDSQILGIFFGEEALMGLVSENHRDRVVNSLSTLRNDVVILLELHRGIAARHACFDGEVKTESEGLQAQEIYMAYLDVISRFEQLAKPVIDYLHGVRIDVTVRVQEMEVDLAKAAAAAEAEQAASTEQPTQA